MAKVKESGMPVVLDQCEPIGLDDSPQTGVEGNTNPLTRNPQKKRVFIKEVENGFLVEEGQAGSELKNVFKTPRQVVNHIREYLLG